MGDEHGARQARSLYLDLLKRALTHTLYLPLDLHWSNDVGTPELREAVREAGALQEADLRQMRAEGRDWPRYAQSMVGKYRLDNVQECLERIIADDVPGDLIEAGVWRGGVALLMRAVLKAYRITDRYVYAADSFRGLPPPRAETYPSDAGDSHHTAAPLAVPREEVEENFRLYDLLDDQTVFLEGWFRDTLPTVSDRTWALVRIDGDMYESTMDALVNLYPGLSAGGYLIVDDFAYEPCRKAVEDFRAAGEIDEPIEKIDWTGVFWRRTA